MLQMRDKYRLKTPLCHSILMNLYYQTGQHEKLDSLISEIEENGIAFDQYILLTFGFCVEGVEENERMYCVCIHYNYTHITSPISYRPHVVTDVKESLTYHITYWVT